ncbi:motility associated factor glycosyltransferase family protein [Campylobacter jejuni]|nr:motility associated factor glycosyltransferase family protein [Campylobacter jejuni]HDV7516841.1 motility associated factor glycosyltransferase family protein [Campylobacter jejuni]HEG2597646.1 motility associated factor glycosyltransferase family protein [Campylobacter jejuni]
MKFNQNQIKLFNRNINALNNTVLKESLKQIKSSKFELILGKDNLDINLKNTSDNTFLYENAIDELNSMLNIYNDKYLLYPVLYFYGFGNGILFKALLQNKNHQHIVVFEKDIEIIWIMFHILDFSNELQNSRLMILETNSLDIEFFSNFCSSKPFFQFSRIYFLELMSNYYERYNEVALKLNNNILSAFKLNILKYGNDPLDALQGIEQFVYNLPQMITHPSYTELLSKRKNLSDTAIIVSTGPSLTKQLPLLKKYANKATIFCADSAYPILAKHDIKPDYVCMLERDDIVSKCFDNDFKEFDKGILFILASVVHKEVIEFLERNNREYILVPRAQNFQIYVALINFGLLAGNLSVAHMNYNVSKNLFFKNIILIGQDLAYSKDQSSHAKDFIHEKLHEGHFQKDENLFTSTAYGGKGKVESSYFWNLFRELFETWISYDKNFINIYNCTEGGARIEGTIEKPFLWACENLLSKDLNKPFPKLNPLNINKQNELMLKTYNKIYKSIYHCKDFNKKLLQEYNEIKELYLTLENLQIEESKEFIDFIIQKIDIVKYKIDDAKNMQDLYEILGPLLVQFELNLARIYVLNPKTSEDSFNKSLIWIKEHLEWIEMIYGHIQAQENALFENIIPLEQKLKERKMQKYLERIKNANK